MDQEAVLTVLREFKKALESIDIRVDSLILYGSHAVGTAREDSDIDVVVISSSFSDKSYWERINILTEAIFKVFAPIEASAFTPEEWKTDKSLIVDYAKNGVLVK
ncbi:MAG: nucleotidyltransferase domain-containing protein [Planctomycetota bacterium]|jgi:predicted nucleotidyltransferase